MAKAKKKPETEESGSRIDSIVKAYDKLTKSSGEIKVLGKDEIVDTIPVVPSGVLSLDKALGVGGYPHGRILEIMGPESCIDKYSHLSYEVWSKDGKRINHKGGSICRLYERFHGVRVEETPNQGCKNQTKEPVDYYVKSVNDEGSIIRNKVLDVVKTGNKDCIEVTVSNGNSIVATPEHKFLTPDGYLALGDLEVGSTVFVHNNTRKKGRKGYSWRPDICVKYHPYWPIKVVRDGKINKDYLYYRGQLSRAVYEAYLNNKSLESYTEALNSWTKLRIESELCFLPTDIHVHHIDENFNNNSIDNLRLIDPVEHGKLHANDRHSNLSFIMTPTKIVAKEIVGVRATYDLKCAFPYNNYIAEGLVVHNSGKTTLTLHAIASAQKHGGICAFVDAEHALDLNYAQNLGVDLEKLMIVQPGCGEEALNAVQYLAGLLGPGDIIVVDSVAALTPRAEIDGEMGDSHMGLQARLMSQAMRKLTGIISDRGVIVLFINQIRMKIGVMFGCFSYDTLVNFTDGRSISIGKVVDEKIEGNVYCLNKDIQEIESKPIIDWHDNGKVETKEDFIHIQTRSINGGGRFGLTCTPDHKILTSFGKWEKAKNLSKAHCLVSKYEQTFNETYGQFLKGCFIGDSHISIRDANTASLKLQDSTNVDYINWKLDKLSPFMNFTERCFSNGLCRYDSDYTYELARVKKALEERDPMFMLEKDYSNLSMALWFMDDGHFDNSNSHCRFIISVKRFKNNWMALDPIASKLSELGFECTYDEKDGAIIFNKENTLKLAEKIAKYIPECMQYKLPKEFRGLYQDFSLSNSPKYITEEVEILDIREASDRQMRNKRKFDISIKDNHNYMVGGKHNGVIVHNSPETTSGGNALKFYASIRIDIRRIGAIKDKDSSILGNRTRIKVIKNKVAPPFREAEVDIRFGEGIPRVNDVFDLALEKGLLIQNGAWYNKADGDKIGQGKENCIKLLKDQPELLEFLEAGLKE